MGITVEQGRDINDTLVVCPRLGGSRVEHFGVFEPTTCHMQSHRQVQHQILEMQILEDVDVVTFNPYFHSNCCRRESDTFDTDHISTDGRGRLGILNLGLGEVIDFVLEDGINRHFRCSAASAFYLLVVSALCPVQTCSERQILWFRNGDDVDFDVGGVGISFGVEEILVINLLHSAAVVKTEDVPELDVARAAAGQGQSSVLTGLCRQIEIVEVVVVVDACCENGRSKQ